MGVHVAFFANKAGLTETEIEATTTGASGVWPEPERALVDAVDALHFRATWSDAEYRALFAHYTEDQSFEILLLCGRYHMVSYVANGLALSLDPRAARFPKSMIHSH